MHQHIRGSRIKLRVLCAMRYQSTQGCIYYYEVSVDVGIYSAMRLLTGFYEGFYKLLTKQQVLIEHYLNLPLSKDSDYTQGMSLTLYSSCSMIFKFLLESLP